jgi:hypothetical protein
MSDRDTGNPKDLSFLLVAAIVVNFSHREELLGCESHDFSHSFFLNLACY